MAPRRRAELKKIPFFVRGKAPQHGEVRARSRDREITVDTLYDAKAHYGR
jgi:light-independent protochlorophyllide reductase subunit B